MREVEANVLEARRLIELRLPVRARDDRHLGGREREPLGQGLAQEPARSREALPPAGAKQAGLAGPLRLGQMATQLGEPPRLDAERDQPDDDVTFHPPRRAWTASSRANSRTCGSRSIDS